MSKSTYTAHAVFESDGQSEDPDKLCEYIERYGGSDPVVSVGGGEVGAVAQFSNAINATDAAQTMLDALNWLPLKEITIT